MILLVIQATPGGLPAGLTGAMMLCVDNKTLHDSRPDQDSGQPPAVAEAGGRSPRDQPREGHAGLVPARDQRRHEVLVRVVLISEALNQRLAL